MRHKDEIVFAQSVIGLVVTIIDYLAMIYRLDVPIVVTSCYRPDDPKYHGKAQAKDVRTNDWPLKFRILVGGVLTRIRKANPMIQFDFEKDHLHLEYDDKSL